MVSTVKLLDVVALVSTVSEATTKNVWVPSGKEGVVKGLVQSAVGVVGESTEQ